MNSRQLFLALALLISPMLVLAEWIPLGSSKDSYVEPKVEILRSDVNGMVVKVTLFGFDVSQVNAGEKVYHRIDLLSESHTLEPGSPEIPYIAKILAIPDQAGTRVEVIGMGQTYTFYNYHLPPARASWWEGAPEPPFAEDPQRFSSMEAYPVEQASMDEPMIFRDFRISRLSVFPVRYVAEKAELQVASSITVKISYDGKDIVNPKTTTKKPISPSFAELYRSSIFNYQEVLNQYYGGREDGRDVMLCIMPDIFSASFQVYANWKRESGIDVQVTKFSDIGANANNPDIIKNYIAQTYSTWEHPPTYVLIVGDNGIFPKKIATYPDYSFAWEEFFVTVDGNDYIPEMMIGRFTNQEDYRMQVMINKFMLYERQPYTQDPDWFRKGLCASNNAYASQVETKRFVANVMLQDGQFISVDTMMSNGSWSSNCTYNLSHIKNALNEGRSYLNYRGEGWSYGWYANCYNFSTDEVSTLNNGQKFTFVTSIGCGVAMFDASGGNCFGEEWIQLGTLTNPRGGIGFIGPTSNTHTTYNNRIDKGIYVGMFREGMDTPGQALIRGKLYMYNVFGNTYWVEYHYKVFCMLGDPSIHIWKATPTDVTVSHPTTLLLGHNTFQTQVLYAQGGLPVVNAQVTITGPNIFVSKFTDSNGWVSIDLLTLEETNLKITVRGGTMKPYQATIEVYQPSELVEPEGGPSIVEVSGNFDGKPNPNENLSVAYTLKNWGSTTANNVRATLTSDDPYVQVNTAAPVFYGNIASNAEVVGNPFQIFIKPNCPIGHTVVLNLQINSNLESWNYPLEIPVKGCILDLKNFLVSDADSESPNFRMDPGETVALFVSVSNHGEDFASEVQGNLSCSNPYVSIVNANGSFGTIAINSTSTNHENFFIITIDESCPVGQELSFDLNLFTQNGLYPYEKLEQIVIPVSTPVPTDFTGPDSYGYHAFSSDDTFYDQIPVYNWVELVGVGTQLNLPNVSDYTQTVDLPFTFKYYGQDYSQVRISTDGWLAFGAGTQTASENTALPNLDEVNNMIAVLWSDLFDDEFFMGKIFYHHDVINHRFIVEWDSISHNNFLTEPVREVFQAILLDPAHYPTPTGDGEIILQYKIVNNPESVTVGIENYTQDDGLLYVFNSNYNATATTLKNNYAIKFTTTPPTSIIPDERVEPEGVPEIIDLGGNEDGLVNPNETINISFNLKNFGTTTANNVQVSLTSADSNIQINTVNPISYGNIAPDQVVNGSPFNIFVLPTCPIGHVIPITIHVSSSISNWSYTYYIEVVGCQLDFNNYITYDTNSPEPNFRMDPGETVVLILSISNIGLDIAPKVKGILSCNSPYITVIDSIGTFGTLDSGSTTTNPDNNFIVIVSESCPEGTTIDFQVKLLTQDGNYPYETLINVPIPVSFPTHIDFTGPDSYGYFAFSSDDTFFDQTPTYNWVEIKEIGTQLDFQNLSDYTETVDLPFDFKYYGVVYTQLRISTDGWVAFGSGDQVNPENASLPSNDNVSSMVAVFWGDLFDETLLMGNIYHHHDTENNRFIVEWDGFPFNNSGEEPSVEVFQLILLNPIHYNTPTGDGEIIFQYNTVNQSERVTVGIENHDQDIALQYVFNGSYDATASPISDGIAIKFTTQNPSTTIPNELIGIDGYPTIVDLNGNSDGLINPNETIQLSFTLKNWGISTANSIQAILTTDDPQVQIITSSPVSFGNIAPNGQSVGQPFEIFIEPSFTIGQSFVVHLVVSSTNYSWDYAYSFVVDGCALNIDNFLVIDSNTPEQNFRMDPGETVAIIVSLSNFGKDIAPDVAGVLTTSNPYITIVEPSVNFGSLAINSSIKNADEVFVVEISENCPTNYMVEFELLLYTQDGHYPYEITTILELPVSKPIPSDFSGPDTYGYYAYSSDDSFYDQTPAYEWFEIKGIGTKIDLPNQSNYTETVSLPFDFKYYGTTYDQLRVSTDGWVAFGAGTQTSSINAPLPNLDDISSMIAVFWDDLFNEQDLQGEIFYHHDTSNHRFVVQWDNVNHNNSTNNSYETFQLILLNPEHHATETGDGEIFVQYKLVSNPESITVGIENHSQDDGLLYTYNGFYPQTAAPIKSGYAVKFTTEKPSTSLYTSDGIIKDPNFLFGSGSVLKQNHPNPFSHLTSISYFLSQPGFVILEVYNIRGELVRTLQSGSQPKGNYTFEWDGLNGHGSRVTPGIYFYRLKTPDNSQTKRMILVR